MALPLALIATPASAQPYTPLEGMLVLPPVEYDFYYPGTIVIRRGDRAYIDQYCPKSPVGSLPTLGCAEVVQDPNNGEKFCHIRMANDDILEATNMFKHGNVMLDDLVRHELAHCNGWGPGHPGQQRLSGTPRVRTEVRKQMEKDKLAEERYKLYREVRS